ncbi:Glutamine-dependent NAD(+) synthetase [Tepidimonas sediminis]|uniref:Glutamine-dependent NAD(+) synthetase n=1 Tax=Tepidimonas sediminis TaxID=2588941 RepID=A0A554WUR0_9BURK|nr:NAD+ synthase [Tepidimonas sediminis]TSE27299.1 Glutamine-dependent NAD(+) synthetase [Tepidimonas sediminis]
MSLRIAVAQLDFVVGDLAGNARRIAEAAEAAHAAGAQVLLTPELAICGYAAEDLLLRPAFVAACDEAVQELARRTARLRGLHLVVGQPLPAPGAAAAGGRSVGRAPCLNAATVLCEGAVTHRYAKRELPNYQVFDERRYFVPGTRPCVVEVEASGRRWRLGLLICEDAWFAAPAAETVAAGAEVLCVLNASPFHLGKGDERERAMRQRVRETGRPLVYAHLVGGQDELVFEGRSFALDGTGAVAARAPSFSEDLFLVELQPDPAGAARVGGPLAPVGDTEHDLWHALVLGTRDYVDKNGFPGAIVGLSGGVDSALVLAIAVDALGPQRVRAVMMPSPYTAEISWLDARAMAARLGVRYDEIPIGPLFDAYLGQLAPLLQGRPPDTTEENLQARIRGTLLMALSNKFGDIVLTTGNKSEMATGYCTLYGDMAGGFAVLKDVAKTWVWRLARWRNAHDPFGRGAQPIPERIITRPPSAELRPGQTDQDSLPPYEVLDAIVERYMENDRSVEEIVAEGFDRAAVEQVVRLLRLNEYKRRQAPVGIRVTHRSFGKDWRYPNTNRWRG